MQTVVFYRFNGRILKETPKAIFFLDSRTGKKAWLPLSVTCMLSRRGEISIPDWFVNKIKWID